jgi:putative nucleotidyltransferase with HDIG domain
VSKNKSKTIPEDRLDIYRKEHDKLILLFNITQTISQELFLDRLLRLIMDEVKNVLSCDRCTVFVLDREKKELWSRVAHGEKEIRFPSHLGIAGHVATTGEVLNIPDAYVDKRFNPEIDKKTGYRTSNILSAPMRNRRGEIIGVFQALNKNNGSFTREDEELLNTISVISATQIENAQLYEEQKKTFESFVETLASTIDARDPLTAGHSKRIALYADQVARVLELPDDQREVLRIAALLHDLGKIAVREAVLTKEGRLTEKEFEHIQSHPEFTQTILEKINFAREFQRIPSIAASHHEKLDGSGYPHGLIGAQIPSLGRLLAVVDVFDALTSKRHYRDRMDFVEVMSYISSVTGTQFDEGYVTAFRKVKLDQLIRILEEENEAHIRKADMDRLAQYCIDDLLSIAKLEQRSPEQAELLNLFDSYYSRSYVEKD